MHHRLVVKRLREHLRRRGDVVVRPQAPVLHLLRMAEGPGRVLATIVPHVAARGHKSAADVLREARVRRAAGIAACAVLFEAAAPGCRCWQPHFEFDLRILRRPRGALHAAELYGGCNAGNRSRPGQRCRCDGRRFRRDRAKLGAAQSGQASAGCRPKAERERDTCSTSHDSSRVVSMLDPST